MSQRVSEISVHWQTYKTSGDIAARDALLEAYLPLVKQVAGRLQVGFPGSVEEGDLLGYGVMGLIDALEKFAPEMGVKFETYAQVRVRGAILDGLRVHDWAPRTLRQKGRRVKKVLAELEATLGRRAEETEIATALGLTLEEFHELLGELNGLVFLSLEQPLDADGESGTTWAEIMPQSSEDDPWKHIEHQERIEELAAAIESLPERERLVITLYYYEELTLKEIGAVMDVSESRACQLHTRALLRLRAHLEREKTLEMAGGGVK